MTNDLAIRIIIGDVLGTTEQTQEAVTMAVKALSALPSAQPDVPDTTFGNMISRQAAIDTVRSYYDECDEQEESIEERIERLPSADIDLSGFSDKLWNIAYERGKAEVVRCKDCKHRWVNEHYGEKGYMKIKAMCLLDTDDPFELGRNAYDDDWFCADGERKDD